MPRQGLTRAAAGLALAGLGALAPLAWAAAPAEPTDSMARRVRACTACHSQVDQLTADGYIPRLAGKPAAYLAAQLRHFRDGRRRNAVMNTLVAQLDDAYLAEIAAHFAALDASHGAPASAPVATASVSPAPAPTPPPPAARLRRGQQLAEQGDDAIRLPACARCHGAALTGVLPAVPGLIGLPRGYLVGQLGAWRTGVRHAAAPDCMAEVVQRLSPPDLEAVADWLVAQPLPVQPRPAPQLAQALPLDCGAEVARVVPLVSVVPVVPAPPVTAPARSGR